MITMQAHVQRSGQAGQTVHGGISSGGRGDPGLSRRGPLLLPFTRVVVPTVDLAAGRIVADPPGSDE